VSARADGGLSFCARRGASRTALCDFGLSLGALALALGLAFGLGGRDTAGRMVEGWYRKGQEAAPRLQQAAANAEQQARAQGMGDGGTGRRTTTVVGNPRDRT